MQSLGSDDAKNTRRVDDKPCLLASAHNLSVSVAIVVLISILALSIFFTISSPLSTRVRQIQKVPQLRVAQIRNSTLPENFHLILQGKVTVEATTDLPSTANAIRLSSPKPVSLAEAQRVAAGLFTMPLDLTEVRQGPELSPDLKWSASALGITVQIDPDNGELSAQRGTPSSEAAPTLETVLLARDWLRQHQIPEGQGEPGSVIVYQREGSGTASLEFETKVDGITVYPSTARSRRASPFTTATISEKLRGVGTVFHHPPRDVEATIDVRLRDPEVAWTEVVETPREHLRYLGFLDTDGASGVTFYAPIDQWNHHGLGEAKPNRVLTSTVTMTLGLTSIRLGYAYAGDAGPDGSLHLVPVYAFETKGSGPGGREMTALFLASAVADEHVRRWSLPRPDGVRVYRDGQMTEVSTAAARFEPIYQSAQSALEGLTLDYLTGMSEQDAARMCSNQTVVEFVYSASVRIETNLGPYQIDHLIVPLASDAASAKAWLPVPAAKRYWLAASPGSAVELSTAVDAAIANASGWNSIPARKALATIAAPTVTPETPVATPTQPTVPGTKVTPAVGQRAPISNEASVWSIVADKVYGISPILRPTYLPPGIEGVQARDALVDTFWVNYDGPGIRLGLGSGAFNPPIMSVDGEQREVIVRGQRATLQISDRQHPSESVLLSWDEPGRWMPRASSQSRDRVFYLISAEGLGPDVVVEIANALSELNPSCEGEPAKRGESWSDVVAEMRTIPVLRPAYVPPQVAHVTPLVIVGRGSSGGFCSEYYHVVLQEGDLYLEFAGLAGIGQMGNATEVRTIPFRGGTAHLLLWTRDGLPNGEIKSAAVVWTEKGGPPIRAWPRPGGTADFLVWGRNLPLEEVLRAAESLESVGPISARGSDLPRTQ